MDQKLLQVTEKYPGNCDRVLSNLGQPANPAVVKQAQFHTTVDSALRLLLLTLVSSLVITILFLLRGYDDNRLLSWQWVVQQNTLFTVLGLNLLAHTGAYLLYRQHIIRRFTISAIVTAAIVLALTTWSLPEHMLDSARYFVHAKIVSQSGITYFWTQWGNDISAWTDLPLISIVYGLAFSLFGESRVVVQIINTTFYAGSLYLTFCIGKLWWGHLSGIYAALMLLAFPYLTMQVSQMLLDVPSMFMIVLAIYCCARAIQNGRSLWIMASCVSIAMTLLSKYSAWLLLFWLLFLPLSTTDKFSYNENILIRYKRLLIVMGGVISILLIVFANHFSTIQGQIALLWEYQIPAFSRWQESLASTFLYQIHPFVTFTAIAAIILAIRSGDRSIILFFIAIASVLLFGALRARYLIIVFPMLALLSAYCLQTFKDKTIATSIASSAAISGIVLSIFANSVFLGNISAVNIQSAGKYLNSLHEPYVLIVSPELNSKNINPETMTPLIDYFTDKKVLTVRNTSTHASTASTKNNPLRFTWAVKPYPYAKLDSINLYADEIAIIHIASSVEDKLPRLQNINFDDFVVAKNFFVQDQVFKLQTVATIYRHKQSITLLKQ